MFLVSIICPVYKTEKFLKRCIESVINQTYKDWELILVDDGSPDNSGRICDEYVNTDKRIKVIHQLNRGPSLARQAGFDLSKGEYILYIDSDDWIDNHMIELMVDSVVANQSDIVICDNYNVYKCGLKYMDKKPQSLETKTVLNDVVCKGNGNVWNKLIKRDCFITPAQIKWEPNVNVFEDLLIMCKLLMSPRIVSHVPKPLYFYNQANVNSLMKGNGMYEKRVVINGLLSMVLGNDHPEEMNYMKFQLAYSALLEGALDKKEWISQFRDLKMTNLYGLDKGVYIALNYNYRLGQLYCLLLKYLKSVVKFIVR